MLNEQLHRSLAELFGEVKIANPGQRASFTTREGDDALWGRVTQGGEEYRICCPYCSDRRFRLYLSYLYGSQQRTEDGRTVRFGSGLAHCFNETACLEREVNRKDFYCAVIGGEPPLLFAPTKQTQAAIAMDVVYPRHIVPLADLPTDHCAIRYLKGRSFDIACLTKLGLVYCEEDARPNVEGTIFMPLFDQAGTIVGGQCRLPYDPEGKFPPKYYTLPHTRVSEHLYKAHRAVAKDMVVVTEGPFDAIRVGDQGVALLGSHISSQQGQLLARHWDTVVFALDSDLQQRNSRAWQSIKSLRRKLASPQHGKRTAIVKLPPGRDPADLSRDEIWDRIKAALTQKERIQL